MATIRLHLFELLAAKISREGCKVSIADVAKGCHMSRQQAYLYFNNKCPNITSAAIGNFCHYFDCTPNDLMVLVEDRPTGEPVSPLQSTICYVYVIASIQNNSYKIGMSSYPETRLYELQSDTKQRDLMFFHQIDCRDTRQARDVEYVLHTIYAENRLHGEWFELEDVDLKTIQKWVSGDDLLRDLLTLWRSKIQPGHDGGPTARDKRMLKQYAALLQEAQQ